MKHIQKRLRRMQARLRSKKLDGIFLTNVQSVRYLSGFTGDDSALLVEPKEVLLITDSRYTESAEREVVPSGIGVVIRKKSLLIQAARLIKKRGIRRVGFECNDMSYGAHRRLQKELRGVELRPAEDWVERLREIKDQVEIAAIRAAIRVAERGLEATLPRIRPGVSERDVATELDHQMRKHGADESAFPLIVASGPRASLPHARPTSKCLQAGEPVLIDWGARLEFYNSDLTRVFFLGTIPRRWERWYEAVLQAQQAALRAVRPNVLARRVDGAARSSLQRERLSSRFGHGLGHGVGLQIHEGPRLHKESESRLQRGMIMTIEPGVYFPGQGGVRIEDVVLVTGTGKEVLSGFEKRLDRLVL